jgi:hypothetical protein
LKDLINQWIAAMQESSESLLETNASPSDAPAASEPNPASSSAPSEASSATSNRAASSEQQKPVEAPASAVVPAASQKPAANETPAIEPERISLIPFVAETAESVRRRANGGVPKNRRMLLGSAAACLALLVAVAGSAAVFQATRSQHDESQNLAEAVSAVTARLDAIDASRPKEEAAEIRKAVSDARGGLATSRDVSATIAQLNARLDRLEHEQDTRLEKLGERVDHDATSRSTDTQARSAELAARIEKLEKADFAGRIDKIEKADLAARMDKIEKKAAATPVAAVTPPTPPQKAVTAAAVSPSVSSDITGSIAKPTPTAPIRGWYLTEMRSGSAIVENRQGIHEVAPGDVLPGAGKIQRFEKRGHEWVVITDTGVIVQASAQNYAPHVVARPPMYGPYGYGPGGGYGDYED